MVSVPRQPLAVAYSAGLAWTGASGGHIWRAVWARRWHPAASNWVGWRSSGTRAPWQFPMPGGRDSARRSELCWRIEPSVQGTTTPAGALLLMVIAWFEEQC